MDYTINGAPGFKLDAYPEGTRTRFGVFRAFSVDGNVVVSDMTIQVGNVPVSAMQKRYYDELSRYRETYQGPVQSEQQRVAAIPLQREQVRLLRLAFVPLCVCAALPCAPLHFVRRCGGLGQRHP